MMRGTWKWGAAMVWLSCGNGSDDVVSTYAPCNDSEPCPFRDEIVDRTAIEVISDIEYASADGNDGKVSLKLDLYLPPEGLDPLRPGVLWMHGGGGTKADGFEDADHSIGHADDIDADRWPLLREHVVEGECPPANMIEAKSL